jgi:hypothetical protein
MKLTDSRHNSHHHKIVRVKLNQKLWSKETRTSIGCWSAHLMGYVLDGKPVPVTLLKECSPPSKKRSSPNKMHKLDDQSFSCTCSEPDNENMIECSFCLKWQHYGCTQLTEEDLSPLINNEHLCVIGEIKEQKSEHFFSELDITITITIIEEIVKAAKALKRGKATGIDRISNEMIKASVPYLSKNLCKTFQHYTPGFIVNIFKAGDTSDPGNCRGITINILY